MLVSLVSELPLQSLFDAMSRTASCKDRAKHAFSKVRWLLVPHREKFLADAHDSVAGIPDHLEFGSASSGNCKQLTLFLWPVLKLSRNIVSVLDALHWVFLTFNVPERIDRFSWHFDVQNTSMGRNPQTLVVLPLRANNQPKWLGKSLVLQWAYWCLLSLQQIDERTEAPNGTGSNSFQGPFLGLHGLQLGHRNQSLRRLPWAQLWFCIEQSSGVRLFQASYLCFPWITCRRDPKGIVTRCLRWHSNARRWFLIFMPMTGLLSSTIADLCMKKWSHEKKWERMKWST